MTVVQQRQPFPDAVAERVIHLLRAGTAPWQQRHGPGEGPELPMNPANGNRYKGINAVQLMSQGRDDPRWLTYDQAQELGAQVRKGEKGTRVQFWKLTEERQKTDNGRPVTDSHGDPVMERVPLERPRAMTAVVFNAEQIDGMPPLPQRQQPSEAAATARVQALLEASGAKVRPVDGTKAYYRAASDTLQMPPSAEFASEASRAATVLRELAHWTGHESRLGRDLAQPFGSAEHAKEQLRTELAAMFMGEALGVGHEPANPGAYTDAWVQLIQEDPLVLLRAAAQAEQIQGYVLKFDQGAVLAQQQPAPVQSSGQGQSEEQASEAQQQAAAAPSPTPTQEAPAVSTAAEENARINAALAAVQQQPAPSQQHQPRPARTASTRSTNMAPKADPEAEFTEALRSMGCLVPQGHPKMDGQPYRIPVTGDRGAQKSGFYVGHLDGLVPAGYIKNNRTGQETRWKAKGYNLTDEQRNRLHAEAAAKLAQRRAEEARRHEATAQRVSHQLAGLRPVDQPTPYLRAKGVQPHPGAFTDAQGKTTFLPAVDKTGKHWTTQYIGEDGIKRFAKDGHKEGCFHVLGGMEALKKAPVIVMGEGYATMATIKEAVGLVTVAAFDSGNLPAVARALRELFPTRPIIVTGDDDRAVQLTQGFNPGREKAEAAAAAVGGRAIFPVFAPGENTYPTGLPPVTPATYRAHASASELLAKGGLTEEATQALQADLLKPEQIAALELMKKHTDFNDLAQKSALGREALLRQVLPEVKQAQQIHHAEVQKQAQEQSQRQAQGVRQRQGHGLRAG